AGMQARKAYFMVRAQVPNESDRAKFDQWYGTHHLPLAMDKFHAEKGWRFWSRSDSSVHYALYQFKDMATLRDRLDSPDFKLLIADFDQAWPGVTQPRPDRNRARGLKAPRCCAVGRCPCRRSRGSNAAKPAFGRKPERERNRVRGVGGDCAATSPAGSG